jgi:hypothetical protein
MRTRFLAEWVGANAVGLSLGFLAVLQTGFLIQFGSNTELHWTSGALGRGVAPYARFTGLLIGGAILGLAQAWALRGRLPRVTPWVVAAAVGFGLVILVIWPLVRADVWGHIPGPVEPIAITIGGGSLAGVGQWWYLRRNGIVATRWLIFWVGGLVGSVALTFLVFFLVLGVLQLPLNWPAEVALSGFVAGGTAGAMSAVAMSTLPLSEAARSVPARQ